MKPDKRWTLKPADEAKITSLAAALQIHPALCRLLVVRGIEDFETSKTFFRPQLSMLHDPFLMKDMQLAVQRIDNAIKNNEKVLIYGDYDVDGTTAVSVVYSFLHQYILSLPFRGGKEGLNYYIPHRYREGYGISKAGIDYAHTNGYTLLITLDCGIKSYELIQYARSLGIDVIVCDHHLPDSELPPAFAILNPKQPGCNYPFKELSGCGIGFKLITALARKWNLPDTTVFNYLDLVATSIAADIVPMDGENRVLAFYGLKKANDDPSLAIKTLKEMGGIRRPLHINDLVFVIGPRVNAAGRMDDARKVIDFFVETDEARIKQLASELHADNMDRKEVDKSITEEALAILQGDDAAAHRKSTVVYRSHWHKGVVGIVASRLIDYYYRPTVVLTSSNDKVSGSARSVRGFNIYEALHACRDLLENYGGHFYAAGITLHPDKLNDFIAKFEEVVTASIPPHLLIPEIEIDAEIRLTDIRQPFYNIINQFEPFGPNNLRPVFITKKVYDYKGYSRIVKDAHLKLVVHQFDGYIMDGIGFNMAEKLPLLKNPVDIVYTIDENEFNGNTNLQIKLLDIKPSV